MNGKSAIEWVMGRCRHHAHPQRPERLAAEVGNPRYILDLLPSIIRLSEEMMEAVRGLPGAVFGEAEVVSPFRAVR